MKYALHTVSFAGLWGQEKLGLEQSIDQAAELGYDGVFIMAKRPHLSVLDHSVEDCRRLRERVEKRNLKVPALAAYTNFTVSESPEVPFLEMQVAHVEALAARAQALGCDLIRVFTGYENPASSFGLQWDTIVRALRECCDRAGKFGVRIGLQNHHDIGVHSKTYRELMGQIERSNLVACYDCWTLHLRGESMSREVPLTAPKVAFTTVADYLVLPRSRYRPGLTNYAFEEPPFAMAVPMGQGDLDYQTFFDALKKGGYSGWAAYEMCSPIRGGGSLANLEAYAKAFLKYMKERGK